MGAAGAGMGAAAAAGGGREAAVGVAVGAGPAFLASAAGVAGWFIRLLRSDFPLRARAGAEGVLVLVLLPLARADAARTAAADGLRFLDAVLGVDAADDGPATAAAAAAAAEAAVGVSVPRGLGGAESSASAAAAAPLRALRGCSTPPGVFFGCLPSRLAIRREALPARRPLRPALDPPRAAAIARKLTVFLWR